MKVKGVSLYLKVQYVRFGSCDLFGGSFQLHMCWKTVKWTNSDNFKHVHLKVVVMRTQSEH